MKLTFYLLILFTFLISCGKKQEIRITALNPVNGEPWAGLHYTITKQKTGAFEEKYKKVGEGYLDENGRAVHTLRLGNASYEINIESPENICYVNNASYTFESNSSNINFEFEMATCAYRTLAVKNINCQDVNDKIIFDMQPIYKPNYDNFIPITKFGCYSNTFIESQVPSGDWSVTWEVTKNGILNNYSDTFHLDTDEHLLYTINY